MTEYIIAAAVCLVAGLALYRKGYNNGRADATRTYTLLIRDAHSRAKSAADYEARMRDALTVVRQK